MSKGNLTLLLAMEIKGLGAYVVYIGRIKGKNIATIHYNKFTDWIDEVFNLHKGEVFQPLIEGLPEEWQEEILNRILSVGN